MRHARSPLLETERLSQTPPTVTGAVLAGAVLAAGAGLAVSTGHGTLLLAAGVAAVGAVAVMRWPALTILALLLVCQEDEATPGGFGAGGSGLLFIGHQLYYTTFSRVSLLTLVAILACARVAVINPPRRLRSISLFLVCLMGFWYVATVWIGGSGLTSAINQDARFALLFVLAFVIGAWAGDQEDWKARSITLMQWVFTLMALIGGYLAGTGQGQAQTGLNVIFYDSALGAAAGAVVVAVVLAPRAARTPRVWWLGGAALLVVVLSSRRNVWAAMIVALLAGLVVARNRARLVVRGLIGLAVILVGMAVFAPSVLTEIGHQLSAIWEASQGSAADTSTQGHLSDISTGLRAVLAHPIGGVGANGHLAGLVVEQPGSLYIHNQILESWLRFGIVGGLLVIAVLASLVARALPVLRRHSDDISVSWAALLLIMAPVALMTAPFFTETQRWPALMGLAAGVLAAKRVATPAAFTDASSALRTHA
jgi:O-antigen ligase